MVNFENQVLDYLGLPSVPRKEWDGSTAFEKGVAIVELKAGGTAYAVASFNPQKGDTKPSIKKVFGNEPFGEILSVFIVPEYMFTDITDADLDEQSKKKAVEIINQGDEIVNENDESIMPQSEWVFDEIHDIEEARAWLTAYNARNKISGRLPSKEETIKLRLLAIKSEIDAKNK